MEEKWLHALGAMVNGIYVLTTGDDARMTGMIASWVSQVSHDPPMVMIAVHPNRYSHQLIKKTGSFALHLLLKEQKQLLVHLKGPEPEKRLEDLAWHAGETGVPILQDCLAYLECVLRARHEPGNHTLYIGEVVGADLFSAEEPMSTLDYEGFYVGKE
ncbi:MAG: flavin reductase [Deltaproteobacteria bacterium]|nr:flavin reductase [Deltaproteobacteria bacterium]